MLSLALTATLAVLAVVAIGVGAADLDVGTVVEVIARRLRLIAGKGSPNSTTGSSGSCGCPGCWGHSRSVHPWRSVA